ncbi:hypothetical protein SynMVIR181_01534 [Synechococcus sp. MVIR-18-1]|nr:hypothetical protein SynMVIR181_01534 [Synechococcus sp. MVIR-18-1]
MIQLRDLGVLIPEKDFLLHFVSLRVVKQQVLCSRHDQE